MCIRCCPLLKGGIDNIIGFLNTLRHFAKDQNKKYCLYFSACHLIPTSHIYGK